MIADSGEGEKTMCKACEDEAERHARVLLAEADELDVMNDVDDNNEQLGPYLIETQVGIDDGSGVR